MLPNADLFPKITENPDGTKQVSMRFNLPPGINPEHCNVTIKDRDLILRCEEKQEKEDSVSRFHYYQVPVEEKSNLLLLLFKRGSFISI